MKTFILFLLLTISKVALGAAYPINGGFVYNSTVETTSGTTTALVATSNQVRIFEGSLFQILKFPNAQLLPADWSYEIVNNSDSFITVRDFDSSEIASVTSGRIGKFQLKSRTSQAGSWKYNVNSSPSDLANYFTKAEHLSVSAGASDAGKPIVLDAAGKVNLSMIPLGGSGDVTGPAGATDGALAIFDGVTGKLLKEGGPTVDATGNMTAIGFTGPLSGNSTTAGALDHNPSACPGGEFVNDTAADGTLTCAVPSGVSMGAFGSSPNANAGTMSGSTLILQPADATNPGGISLSSQTLGSGTKTVDNLIDSGLTASQAVVTDGSKQLASLAYGTPSSASSLVQRDSNQNAFANNFVSKGTNVVSAAGTTTLTSASTRLQNLTGSSTQTFVLPDATTMSVGSVFEFDNNSTGTLTINANGGGLIVTVPPGGYSRVKATAVSTSAGVWDAHFLAPTDNQWGFSGLSLKGTGSATGNIIDIIDSIGNRVASVSKYGNATSNSVELAGNLKFQARAETTTTLNSMVATSSLVRLGTGVTTLNGIAASRDGTFIAAYNATNANITVNNESGSATNIADRIHTPTGGAVTLAASQTMGFIYDGAISRWKTMFSPPSSSAATTSSWSLTSGFTWCSGFGTPTNVNIWTRRVGDTLEARGSFSVGTVAAAATCIILPTGYVIDDAKFGTIPNIEGVGGTYSLTSATNSGYLLFKRLYYDGSTTDRLFFAYQATGLAWANSSGSADFQTGVTQDIEFKVPIVGW